VRELAFAVGISGKGIPIESMDGKPVRLVILLVAGERQQKEYLTLLAAILNILKKKGVKERIIRSRSAVSVLRIISEHDGPAS
jgi:PTS system nitrogen regulatory IIA component